MQIDLINDFEAFAAIRTNWNVVYERDPHAQFFLSWEWLSGWLAMVSEPWLILAAKINTEEEYVAFFPIKLSLEQDEAGTFYTELCMAGNSMADYTGLLCLPDHEAEVIPAFATYIQQQLVWYRFELQNFLETDRRMQQFLTHFSREQFEFSQLRIRNLGEELDQYVAPYIALLDDWDRYLEEIVSSNTRQKIRRFLKKVDQSDELHITHVNSDTLEAHIEILVRFWQTKWGEKKGDNCPVITDYIRRILSHCFDQDCLYFPVLWKGDTPLGTIANFVDHRHRTILFFIAGRDETVKNPPPGLILHADAIRYAIQNGFKVYDFLRGNEDYKYSFGVKERRIQHLIVNGRNRQAQLRDGRILDGRMLPLVLQQTIEQHRSNQLTAAEQGYHQILSVQPDHTEALYYLAALMKQQGAYKEAERLIKRLLISQPNSGMAWFSLGGLYQAQGNVSEAIAAYRQSIAFQPNSPAVYNNLGFALQQQQAWEEAIACYRKALELQPDCPEAEVNLATVLHAQGRS